MNTLREAVQEYLALRRALGFKPPLVGCLPVVRSRLKSNAARERDGSHWTACWSKLNSNFRAVCGPHCPERWRARASLPRVASFREPS
jgi:hypothetical protein